jgi:hypothetical protein
MSREITLEKEKTKLEKKLAKERGKREAEEYIAELESMDKEALEKKLLEYSKTGQGLINTKNADTELQSLKDRIRDQNRLHNEGIRRNKDHQRLISLIISDKFGDELMDVKEASELEDVD